MSSLAPVTGGILGDIITWVRRIIKSPSAQAISNGTISDYINRFMQYDLSERLQLFEFHRQYTFETVANIFYYQAPYVSSTTPNFPITGGPPPFSTIPSTSQPQTVIPTYQNFAPPIYCDGIQLGYFQFMDQFRNLYPDQVQNEILTAGDGTVGPYTGNTSNGPLIRGFVDDLGNLEPYVFVTAKDGLGSQQIVVDSGSVDGDGLGILIQTDSTFQNIIGPAVADGGSGTIDYETGAISVTFLNTIPSTTSIYLQTSIYTAGKPRIVLMYNNIFRFYPVPDRAYKIQVDAYVNPIAFFNTADSVPFAYMSEYIARGAAQKILSDTGDWDQFQKYEPIFREQENLVLRRSERQRGTQRTPTIFQSSTLNGPVWYTGY